jgi:hypothetical protein
MYELRQHKTLTVERWSHYSRAQQVVMIANELNRARNWIEKKSFAEVQHCYERALELCDLTTADKGWSRNVKKELRRFREMLASQYVAPEKDEYINQQLYTLLLHTDPEAWNMLTKTKEKRSPDKNADFRSANRD